MKKQKHFSRKCSAMNEGRISSRYLLTSTNLVSFQSRLANQQVWGLKGALQHQRERNTSYSHVPLFFLFIYCSAATPWLTTQSHFVGFSPLSFHLLLSHPYPSFPWLLVFFFTSALPPPSLSGMRGTGLVHLRVMALWQAETSAPSPGHAAVPALCNAYHPKHTSTQER